MKRWFILLVLTGGSLFPLFFLDEISDAFAAPAGLLYVAPQGDCGGASPCYADVQTAVSAAAPGDEIRIAQGVYTGTHTVSLFSGQTVMTQVVFISQSVQLQGGYAITDWQNSDPAARPTILDAEGNGRVVSIVGGGAITIAGLSLTNGSADMGGGLYAVDDFNNGVLLTMRDNAIYNNSAQRAGGGVSIRVAGATIISNTIANNRTTAVNLFGGGGVEIGHMNFTGKYAISSNQIIGNQTAGNGGGIAFTEGGTAISLTISGNNVMSNTAVAGGGLFGYAVSRLQIYDNQISYNRSQQGGGADFISSFDVTMENNRIQNNVAQEGIDGDPFVNGQGGGVASDSVVRLRMNNNVLADNTAVAGGGLFINTDSFVWMNHNTFARNGQSAIQINGKETPNSSYTRVAISNTVMVSHSIGISVTGYDVTLDVEATLWHSSPVTLTAAATTSDTIAIANDYTGDPLFAADGYHLTAGSAAIDRGMQTAVTADMDGDARPQGNAPDLGADEFIPLPPQTIYTTYLPLVQK